VPVRKRLRRRLGARVVPVAGLLAWIAVAVSGCGDGGGSVTNAGDPPTVAVSRGSSAPPSAAATRPSGPPRLDPRSTWYGRIDLTVFLCSPGPPSPGGCAGGDVTETQRQAVKDRLQELPGVDTVFYESRAEAFADFKKVFADSRMDGIRPEQVPESFRVKLTDRSAAHTVVAAMDAYPGVSSVMVYG
jgi:hypothetical protein